MRQLFPRGRVSKDSGDLLRALRRLSLLGQLRLGHARGKCSQHVVKFHCSQKRACSCVQFIVHVYLRKKVWESLPV